MAATFAEGFDEGRTENVAQAAGNRKMVIERVMKKRMEGRKKDGLHG